MAVTSTNNLRKGSQGGDVTELQRLLNSTGNGYNLAEDGSFGDKTLAAVKDYQQRNGLAVDGIVGTKTWGSLTGGASNSNNNTPAGSNNNTPAVAAPEKSYRYDAENDDTYQQALKNLAEVKGQAPVLAGTFDDQVNQLFDRIMNREDFSYDLNGDAMWQQLKDQHTTQGKMAMMDTMGQAAALTGGYGSSYAQSVGQQAYQGQLQKLTESVPELYQLALQKYNNDQALLRDQLAAAREQQLDEYGRYQDALAQHNLDVDRAQSAADTAYNRGSDAWLTEEQLRTQDEQTAYNRRMDAYNNLANLIAGTGYSPSQSELDAAGMTPGQATALAMQYDREQKAAAAAGASKSTKKVEEDKPKELSTKEYYEWQERFADAADDAAAQRLVEEMELLGYDSNMAFYLYEQYLANKPKPLAETTQNSAYKKQTLKESIQHGGR